MSDRFRTAGLDWEDVRFFAALARHGSLSATARALTVNHATVARRLAALEQALGTKLFKRRPNGYELTAAARVAYAFYAAPAWRDRLKHGTAPLFIGFDESGAQFPEAQWLARRFGKARL